MIPKTYILIFTRDDYPPSIFMAKGGQEQLKLAMLETSASTTYKHHAWLFALEAAHEATPREPESAPGTMLLQLWCCNGASNEAWLDRWLNQLRPDESRLLLLAVQARLASQASAPMVESELHTPE